MREHEAQPAPPEGEPQETHREDTDRCGGFATHLAASLPCASPLHEGPDLSGKDTLYARTLGAATLAAYPEESYLDDVDAFFYSANYLRAWMLQAQLTEKLISEFGRRWWREDRAGKYLLDLWRSGQAEDGDELSGRMGFGRLTSEPLAAQIEGLLTE